jgi:hypothetical protein
MPNFTAARWAKLTMAVTELRWQRALRQARQEAGHFAEVLLADLPTTDSGHVVCDLNELTTAELWALGRTDYPLPPRDEVSTAQLLALASGADPAAVFGAAP